MVMSFIANNNCSIVSLVRSSTVSLLPRKVNILVKFYQQQVQMFTRSEEVVRRVVWRGLPLQPPNGLLRILNVLSELDN